MRMILLTMGALISLAVSTLTAVSQSKPETLRFPGDQEWWFTNETPDGSLMLSTQSNDPREVPFYMICKLGDTDEGKRHVRYYTLFQPPVPPVKDSSGTLVYRFRISKIWDPPDRADVISVPVHDGHADRVEVSGDTIAWLLFHESCHPVAKRNCGREFVIEYQSPDADAKAREKTYIKTRTGRVMPKYECSGTGPCVDCTFLDYKTCYEEADKLGLIDKNDRDLEYECKGAAVRGNVGPSKGRMICPVPGAVIVDAPQKPGGNWDKVTYRPPPLSAARLFSDRCANLGIPPRKPPPPPPPAAAKSVPAPEQSAAAKSAPAPEQSTAARAPEQSAAAPAPEPSTSTPPPEQSAAAPAPEQSTAARAPEQSTAAPAPEQPRGWIAEVKKSRPICPSADDYVQFHRDVVRYCQAAIAQGDAEGD
jgi:hypothetical protein